MPFSPSSGKGELWALGRSGRQRQPGASQEVLWRRFRPRAGGFTYRRPSYPGSKYRSWTRLLAAPGLAPRGTRGSPPRIALQPGGWIEAGAPILHPMPHGPRKSEEVSGRLACPGPESPQDPSRPGNPRAAGTGSLSELPACLRKLPGRGEAGSRMGMKKARRAGSLRERKLRLQGVRSSLPTLSPPRVRSSAAVTATSPSTPVAKANSGMDSQDLN